MQLATPSDGGCDVLFLAGEHSGDQHAARLAADLWAAHSDLKMAAIGGRALEQAGVQLLHDLTESSVVGLVEVLKNYGYFRELFESTLNWVVENRPKVLVLVDYPGFNLRLAKALADRGISRKGGGDVAVYQYISPQIWAWKAGRRFKMARYLDEVGAIFPFEPDCYKDTDLPVQFVGHPFADSRHQLPLRYAADAGLLLLPGSRKQAVLRIFPLMLQAWKCLDANDPLKQATVLFPSEPIREILQQAMAQAGIEDGAIQLVPAETPTAARAVLTSSGTMSLVCAMAGIPGAIVYRAHPITYWIGRRLVRIPYLGMANLILDEVMYPEFLQGAAHPKALISALHDAQSPDRIERTQKQSTQLAETLRAESGSTAVDRIFSYLVPTK
ncbi:MAG: lipid-A-disaccharide synthase [Opitutales bacterium]|nr:lipid-A-disaccharide synthase [Opitutales bacterium]